ncbi:class I adenylate-forming enzyme family protein [Serratia sp. M24T3]|uniref:class I adenylate-forming enzyme family protein n=1 Tax=Serratia sp. M24T3 TaxID=932213 RepID=UPI00025B8E0C|nr:class I adenylate-forming enzyme family protein [Serratia sp. M24T3]EIC86394.1 AMP-dependent protein [Serratia sp. M24T3]
MPVHDKVCAHAAAKGEETAINIAGKSLSWRQLWQRTLSLYSVIAEKVGNQRHNSSIASGPVIAVALGNDLQFPPAWLAATANQNICAVIDPMLPLEQLRDVLTRLQPDLLLLKQSQNQLQDLAHELKLSTLLVEDTCSKIANHDVQAVKRGVDAPTPFLINFTSGTTSTPKAFMRSRHSWRVSFKNGYQIFDLAHANSTLFPGPLFHGIGLYCLNEALDAGTPFFCMEKWDAAEALTILAQHQVQRLVLVPTMLTAFSRLQSADLAPLNQLTHLLSAGAKLEMNHYRHARSIFPNARVQEYYGASELGFIAVSTLDDENVDDQLATVGLPFPEVSWSIRDEQGQALPPNTPGTIYLNSEQICSGYLWGDDGKAFTSQLFGSSVRDIGYINELGCLVVIGRSGDMIVSGGNNIYLSEIESALKSLPGMIEAVVIALEDDYRGKKLIAFFESETLDVGQLPELCLLHLAKYKVPAEFYKMKVWPLTPSGKIKRSVLEKKFINHEI